VCVPYRPFAFPQGAFFLTYLCCDKRQYPTIPTVSVSILEFILVVRLLVRCVTGFNKECPHLLSARLWQLKTIVECAYPHPNGGLKSGKREG
jgi:hypothetical protein